MKRILIGLLGIFLIFSLVGCNSASVSIDNCTWELYSALKDGERTHGSKDVVLSTGEGEEIDCILYADNGKISINDKTNDISYVGAYKHLNTSPDSMIYEISINDSDGKIVTALTKYLDDSSTKTLILSIDNYTLTFYDIDAKE